MQILLACKIHTNDKINREGILKERLQYLSNAQILYWNLIGQNKSIHPKLWPNKSTARE